MRNSNTPAPVGAVERLEQRLSNTIPTDYAEFLTRYNGGLPKNCIFTVPGNGASSVVFLGVETHLEHNDLDAYNRQYVGYIPKESLCIGFDPGGNLILLIIAGEHIGSIWFWYHEREASTLNSTGCIQLSTSFTDFISNLEFEDNEEW